MTEEQDSEVVGRAYDATLMRRLLGQVRPHAGLLVLSFLLMLLRIGADLLGPYVIQQTVDGPVRRGDAAGLVGWVALFLLSVAGGTLLGFGEGWFTSLLGQRVILDLRTRLYRHLQRLPQSFFDRTPVGRLLTRVTGDVENLNELVTSGLVEVVADVLLLLGIVVMMFVTSWRLALVTMALSPLILVTALLFSRLARRRYREMRRHIAAVNSWLNESVVGIRTIQLFGRQAAAATRWDSRNQEFKESAVGAILVYSLFYPTVEFLSALGVALLVWYGGTSILHTTLTFGGFLAFWFYAQKFFQPIRNLSEKYNILQAAMASAERIFGLLDTPAAAPGGTHRTERIRGEIAFEDVHFGYTDQPVLDGVSFRVEPGQTVAIVGLTGAGKSTIIHLLLRLYEVTRGRITIDGVDLREYDLEVFRRQTALVLQDVFLFSGSVAENLAPGGGIAEDRLRQAVAAANARFIEQLPQGFATPLGERGHNLSTGERQLLSFARALAADPQLLILDEATSSVDSASEALIQDALTRLLAGRTSIVIAHRLSTIRHADRIIVLHQGRVAESGTHDELLAAHGLYAQLHRFQMDQ